tara:strand:+ start:222 stop:737 length:516 start_codon:yes stop_codon:yes gene_type:complete
MKKILCFPHPLLRKKTSPLKSLKSEDIELANEMMEIMENAPGIGLAANQIGVLKQIITVNINEGEKQIKYALFNPKILIQSKDKVIMEEGCLSFPEQFADVERSKHIIVEYINIKNKLVKKEAKGLEARVLQHEIDHLSGKLFIDYLSNLKKNILIKKLKKLNKNKTKNVK